MSGWHHSQFSEAHLPTIWELCCIAQALPCQHLSQVWSGHFTLPPTPLYSRGNAQISHLENLNEKRLMLGYKWGVNRLFRGESTCPCPRTSQRLGHHGYAPRIKHRPQDSKSKSSHWIQFIEWQIAKWCSESQQTITPRKHLKKGVENQYSTKDRWCETPPWGLEPLPSPNNQGRSDA